MGTQQTAKSQILTPLQTQHKPHFTLPVSKELAKRCVQCETTKGFCHLSANIGVSPDMPCYQTQR